MVSCPILIAETDSSTLEALPRILHDHVPGIHIDLCTSVDDTLRFLNRQQYGALVTSVHLVQSQQGLMLNRLHALQALTPVLVTATTAEVQSTRRALQEGAFDFIAKPIKPDEAVRAMRRALWQSRLLRLLTSKDNSLERLEEHMSRYPSDERTIRFFRETLASLNQTIAALETSIDRLKKTEESFIDVAAMNEAQTRQQALTRLLEMSSDNREH